MRLLAIPLLVIVALWNPSETEGAWWDPFSTGRSSCIQTGYFVNPVDCSRFYRCIDQSTPERRLLVRYDFECPPKTVFSQSVKVCVPPGPTGCSGWSSGGGGGGGGGSGGSSGGGSGSDENGGSSGSGWSSHPHHPPHHHDHDHHHGWGWDPDHYWSWSHPGNSVFIIYDHHGKKRAARSYEEDSSAASQ